MSRGILEVEARPEADGTTMLLTLLRCVGWLSRSDLATRRGGAGPELETPDAQELGGHRFEFAVATFRGSYLEGDYCSESKRTRRHRGYFRAPRRARSRRRCCWLQQSARNVLDGAPIGPRKLLQGARLQHVADGRDRTIQLLRQGRARLVDLAGRAVKRAGLERSRDGAITIELKPFEIVTFEVRGRAPVN